jgi:hypothetical protein
VCRSGVHGQQELLSFLVNRTFKNIERQRDKGTERVEYGFAGLAPTHPVHVLAGKRLDVAVFKLLNKGFKACLMPSSHAHADCCLR